MKRLKVFLILSLFCLSAMGVLHATNFTFATDTFQRPDVNPLGPNWSGNGTASPLQLVSHTARISNIVGPNYSFYNGITWPNNQWSSATMSVTATGSSYIDVAVRGSTSADTYYSFIMTVNVSNDANTYLVKHIAGAQTILAQTTGVVGVTGDVAYLEVQGTALICKRNGVVIPALSVTDASIASGSPGAAVQDGAGSQTIRITSWSGGGFSAGGSTIF